MHLRSYLCATNFSKQYFSGYYMYLSLVNLRLDISSVFTANGGSLYINGLIFITCTYNDQQVWKLKGEEYRVHGMWGWQWLSSHRRAPHTPMSTVGLRSGGEKYMVPIKSPTGLRSLSINYAVYKQLASKAPSLKPCLLSPNQRSQEMVVESSSEEKKNEIIIASTSKGNHSFSFLLFLFFLNKSS